jgi:hypothetical protein
MPNENDECKETKLALAGECHNSILYTSNIYDKARKEGLIKNGWKPLIDYVKNNKLLEEKQINIIKNKIIRCGEIKFIYESDKYKDIQNYIRRLYFDINSLAKLKDDDYYSFKFDLIELLDKEFKKTNNIENIIIKEENNNIVTDFGSENRNCKKCIKPVTKKQHDICDKCINICIVDDCEEIKDDSIEFCEKHMLESLGNSF